MNPAVTIADAMEGGIGWGGGRCPTFALNGSRGNRWSDGGAFDVRAAGDFAIGPRAKRSGAGIQRVRCDVRSVVRHLGLFAPPPGRSGLCRRSLHHGSVLVHCVYFVCESRRHDCAMSQRHIRRDPTHRCSLVCGGAISGGINRDAGVSLARPRACRSGINDKIEELARLEWFGAVLEGTAPPYEKSFRVLPVRFVEQQNGHQQGGRRRKAGSRLELEPGPRLCSLGFASWRGFLQLRDQIASGVGHLHFGAVDDFLGRDRAAVEIAIAVIIGAQG